MSSNVLDRYDKYYIINNIINEKIKNAENKCLYPLKYGEYTLNNIILLLLILTLSSLFIFNSKNLSKFLLKLC
jgi:hypothetical protein